jgi:transcription elongation factor Elf1
MPVNIKDFCDTERSGTKREPFIIDGWEYATDGVVAIRRKTDKPNTDHDFRVPKSIVGIFERKNAIDESKQPIKLPAFESCKECRDKVFTYHEVECDECGGEGESECPRCGHESECEECDGTGNVDEMIKCDRCELRYTVDANETHELAAKYCLLLARHGVHEIRQACIDTARFEIVDGEYGFEGIICFALK